MHGVARDHQSFAGAESLLAPIEHEDAAPLEDHDRLLAVVPMDGGGRAGSQRLHPNLEVPEAVKVASNGAVGEAGELVLRDLVVCDDHGCILSFRSPNNDTIVYRIGMSMPRSPGRPRSPEVDAAILSAAAHLLAEEGYARMSFDAVASAAGVSRSAIYRRFSSKADLATAALVHLIDNRSPRPADLDVEAALTRALEHLARRLRAKKSMALVGTLLVEEEQTPELITLFRERVWAFRADVLREILDRARTRGEVREDVDDDVVIGMLIGSLYAAHLGHGKIPRNWPSRVAKSALDGVR